MASDWIPRYWPRVAFHTFLSHAAEDRESLVVPVDTNLRILRWIPWLDKHQYPSSRKPMEALRTELLRCRHVVYFVTSGLLRQGRGWTAAERALVDQMQAGLEFRGLEFQHVEFPLIFTKPDDPLLQRSIWAPLIPKAKFYVLSKRNRESKVAWSVRMIKQFLQEEELWAASIDARLRTDAAAKAFFAADAEILRRLRAVDPTPLNI